MHRACHFILLFTMLYAQRYPKPLSFQCYSQLLNQKPHKKKHFHILDIRFFCVRSGQNSLENIFHYAGLERERLQRICGQYGPLMTIAGPHTLHLEPQVCLRATPHIPDSWRPRSPSGPPHIPDSWSPRSPSGAPHIYPTAGAASLLAGRPTCIRQL